MKFEETTFSGIFGVAGTGKSTMVREATEKSGGKYVLCSTTGISAVNLGAGITINSLLWYFDTSSLLDAYTTGKLHYRLGMIYKAGVRRIICDEISMMPKTNFSIICMAIEQFNDSVKEDLGFTICGDWFQLPSASEDTFAFESEYWDRFVENLTELNLVYRQDDPAFIDALQLVRHGKGKECVDYFNDVMFNLVDPHFEGTTLYPYNSNVARQNQYRLEAVTGAKLEFKSTRTGKPRTEWKHIPETLNLKEGALIMILANAYAGGELLYCNGDLGTIESGDNESIEIRLKRNNEVVKVVYIDRDNVTVDSDGNRNTVGNIRYLPIRLAYSSTIDKVQSLTLDLVQADIRAKFFRKRGGMLYTALSRARSKKGLRLIGGKKTFVQNCIVNPKLKDFV